jgi:hypothetical protein
MTSRSRGRRDSDTNGGGLLLFFGQADLALLSIDYHLPFCDALGLDYSWYKVSSVQKMAGTFRPLERGVKLVALALSGMGQTTSKFPLRNWGDKSTVWNRGKPL